jgi:hypothetical protein
MGSITAHIYDLLQDGNNYEEPRPKYGSLPNFFEAVDPGAKNEPIKTDSVEDRPDSESKP